MSFPGTIIVVGDLHMAGGADDPFSEDRAFAAFLAAQAERRDAVGRPLRLVILGDLFDFPATPDRGGAMPVASEAAALRRLERVASAHPTVIDALAGFAAVGGGIDVVAGNHDAELAHPRVWARVSELLEIPTVVASTDLLGIFPASMGLLMEKRLQLQVLEIPLELSPVPVYAVWHESRRADTAHRWLREVVMAELGRSLTV